MEKNSFNNQADRLTSQLLRTYSAQNQQDQGIEDPSPFFMAQLRTRISHESQISQFWALGVISAQKWLVALSCVALLFFFGNVVVVGTQTQILSPTPRESSHYELEDAEDIHTSDEALNVDVLQKE